MAKPIEIFRAGRHTSMSGETVDFSTRDLAAAVRAYDPALHEAPIVIGHPRHDAPAYGWVKQLRLRGDVLEAVPRQVEPAFAEIVASGRYKKVSASFYRPDSPNNPKPGVYYLRHVGFLGAMPPAVRGLKQVEFAGSNKDCLTVEFAASDFAGVFARLRAWIVKQFGEEAAEEALPQAELEAVTSTETTAETTAPAAEEVAEVKEEIVEGATESAVQAVSEVVPELSDEQKAKLEEAIEQAVEKAVENAVEKAAETPAAGAVSHAEPRRGSARPDLDRRERELKERERKLRRSEFAQFLEGLVRDGRPLPLKRDAIIDLMEVLDGATGTISFGEGKTKAPLEVFKTILQKLPRRIHFSEFADGGQEGADSPTDIARRAQAYQAEQAAKGIVVTTAEAVRHVKGQQ